MYLVAIRIVSILVILLIVFYFANPAASHEAFITLTPGETSKSLFKSSANFEADYKERRFALADRDDLLQMYSCIRWTPEQLADFGNKYKSKAYPMYIDAIELLTNDFVEMNTAIVARIQQLQVAQEPNGGVVGPIYAIILQTPYYPDGRGGWISLMNYNIQSGYGNAVTNATLQNPDMPKILITTYLIFPRHNRDGTPDKGIGDNVTADRIKLLTQHATRDPLCFMQCPGDINTFCGCRSANPAAEPRTEVGTEMVPFQSICLSPEPESKKSNYANMYRINEKFIAFEADSFQLAADIASVGGGEVREYPPQNIGAGHTWIEKELSVPELGNPSVKLPKYSKNIITGAYGVGEYVAWTNSIWAYGWVPRNWWWRWAPQGAFDKVGGDQGAEGGWHVQNTQCIIPGNVDAPTPRPYVALSMPDTIVLKLYTIAPRVHCCIEQAPSKWTIWGSGDGNNWVKIDSQSDIRWTTLGQPKVFKIPNNQSFYKMYKMEIFRSGYGGGRGCVHIGEWRLYGIPLFTTSA